MAADCNRDYLDAHGALWTVDTDDAFAESANDAYDGYGQLTVIVGATATSYEATDDQACAYEDGDRETAFPTEASSGGLQVSRKVYVPATGLRFGRILDIVSNPTAAPITARLEFAGNYGTDGDTLVVATSSGDTLVDVGDAWAALDEGDGEDTKIASLWDWDSSGRTTMVDAADDFPEGPVSETAPGATDGDDDVTVGYDDVTIGPGETVIYMHIEHTTEGRPAEFARAYGAGSEQFYSGLSAAERSQLRNWPPESDEDKDEVFFSRDNCPTSANAGQADTDRDGQGDACDADDDGDGLSDSAEGEFGLNATSADTDGDGRGDREDACPKNAGTGVDGCPQPQPIAAGLRAPKGVSAQVMPRRERDRPYRFRINGAVTPPDGLSLADACTGGRVRVSVKAGRQTIAIREAALMNDCTYSLGISFARSRRFGAAQRLRFVARFLGNARMSSARSPTVTARVRTPQQRRAVAPRFTG